MKCRSDVFITLAGVRLCCLPTQNSVSASFQEKVKWRICQCACAKWSCSPVWCFFIRSIMLRIPLQRKLWKSFKITDFQYSFAKEEIFPLQRKNSSFAKEATINSGLRHLWSHLFTLINTDWCLWFPFSSTSPPLLFSCSWPAPPLFLPAPPMLLSCFSPALPLLLPFLPAPLLLRFSPAPSLFLPAPLLLLLCSSPAPSLFLPVHTPLLLLPCSFTVPPCSSPAPPLLFPCSFTVPPMLLPCSTSYVLW